PEAKHRGIACFLVDTEHSGYSSQEIHGKLELHGSDTASLTLDEVEVPEDAVLGEVGDGFKIAMSELDSGRYSVAAGCVGICQGCVNRGPARTIGVVGAGTMGAGIAQLACQAAGARTLLHDPEPDALRRGTETLQSHLKRGVDRGRLSHHDADQAQDRLEAVESL